MISISLELLEFLVPELQGKILTDLSDLASRAQLEIDSIEEMSGGDKIIHFKPICNFRNFSTAWILAQELRLSLDEKGEKYKTSLMNLLERHSSNMNSLLKELFGPDLQSSFFHFLVEGFVQQCPEAKDYIEEFLKIENRVVLSRPKSEVKLSSLLPMFDVLQHKWNSWVIPKLKKSSWEFSREDDDHWIVYWPPWYFQDTLPPFSEILGRLLPLDQSPKDIKAIGSPLLSCTNRVINSGFLKMWNEVRNFLFTKGFIECNTSKFIEKSKILYKQEYCLTYNKLLTLRDHLHYSLVFDVLLKNLNNKRKIYPVFELSFCPWNNCWLLGLSSPIELKDSKDIDNFWYGVEEFKEFLKFIFEKFLNKQLEFVAPEEGEYLPHFCGALIYRMLVNKRVFGQIVIHRLEQFEIRKKELISASIKISNFN